MEMDSTGCNFYYCDILAQKFPSAKFILTLRNCYSWVDSMINEGILASYKETYNCRKPEESESSLAYYFKDLIGLNLSLFRSKEYAARRIHLIVDRLLSFWANTNENTIQNLPSGRSLVLPIDRISDNFESIAELLQVPADTLAKDESFSNKGIYKFNMLKEVSPAFLRDKSSRHCASLMGRYFPEVALDDFLRQGDRRPMSPAVIWFSGLPDSGKSRVAAGVTKELKAKGLRVVHLDEDQWRRFFPRAALAPGKSGGSVCEPVSWPRGWNSVASSWLSPSFGGPTPTSRRCALFSGTSSGSTWSRRRGPPLFRVRIAAIITMRLSTWSAGKRTNCSASPSCFKWEWAAACGAPSISSRAGSSHETRGFYE